jgi:hypothetical protein
MSPGVAAVSCPSAQPDMEDARVFGVIGGSEESLRVSYLRESPVLDEKLVRRLGVVQPTLVFRFAARCEEARCAHFDGQHCTLAQRIVETLEPVVDALPPCIIRASCRWYAEQGAEACFRCPQVVTVVPPGNDELGRAALPAAVERTALRDDG